MSGGRDCDVLMEEGVSATTETMILSPPPSLSTASLNDGIDEDEEFDSQIIVEVEAPATLAGGYVFWATTSTSSNDENGSRRCKSPLGQRSAVTFPVQVPSCGVSAGECMRVPLLKQQLVEHVPLNSDDSDSSIEAQVYNISKPVGEHGIWKGGIFSCFQRGIFHPDPWSAFLCPHVLLGKVLMRSNLTSLAQPSICSNQRNENSKAARSLRWAVRILLCTVIAVYVSAINYWQDQDYAASGLSRAVEILWWQELFSLVLTLPLSIWALVVIVRLRTAIRERDEIPRTNIAVPSCRQSEEPMFQVSLGKSEDLVCTLCCGCCVLSQIAHQTADYEVTDSVSCCNSRNGMMLGNSPCTSDSNSSFEQQNQGGKSSVSNTATNFFQQRGRQNSSDFTLEEPLMTSPQSLSNSTTSNNSYLRHLLLSSPPASALSEVLSIKKIPRDDGRACTKIA